MFVSRPTPIFPSASNLIRFVDVLLDWNRCGNYHIFILLYVLFLLLGALIFYELNHVEEKKRHIDVNRQIQRFLERNRQCLKSSTSFSLFSTRFPSFVRLEEDLFSYVDYFLDKSHTGLWHSAMSNGNISKWTFGQGLFFSTSLLTTVGKTKEKAQKTSSLRTKGTDDGAQRTT